MLGLFSHADKILEHDARGFADFIYATRRAVSRAAKSLTLDFNPVMHVSRMNILLTKS